MNDFYSALLAFDGLMIIAGMWLNRTNKKMFFLVAIIGLSIFMPIFKTKLHAFYYAQCLLIDIIVLAIALLLRLKSKITWVAGWLSGSLCIVHMIGMVVGPQSGVSPYRATVPVLEVALLLACILFSVPVVTRLKSIYFWSKKR